MPFTHLPDADARRARTSPASCSARSTFSNFFVLTLYVQQVLGYSALKTGAHLPRHGRHRDPVAGVSQALVTRIGVRPVMAAGLALIAGAMLWYAQIPVHGRFAADLLPGYLMMGFGLAFTFIPVSIAALAGVAPQEAGLASGLINTSQQIGGALGVAIASTVAFTHVKTLLAAGHTQPEALTAGSRSRSGCSPAFGARRGRDRGAARPLQRGRRGRGGGDGGDLDFPRHGARVPDASSTSSAGRRSSGSTGSRRRTARASSRSSSSSTRAARSRTGSGSR